MSGGVTNALEMSDEDFLKLNDPSQLPGSEAPAEPEVVAEEPAEEEQQEEADPAVNDEVEEEVEEGETSETDTTTDDEPGEGEGEATETAADDGEAGAADGSDGGKPEAEAGESKETPTEQPDYKAFFEQITGTFKANGRDLKVNTAEEAITLMQMGANYTKKMQDIQPHRKVLMMLEDNELLDQGKLSFLVDVAKHDPAAIKKLLKDANIDPLDIDMESASEYLGGSHQISDQQANLREAIKEIGGSEAGRQTLQLIDTTWDDASKDAVWDQPEILSVIQSQRDNGIYDQIVAELDRRKTLGQIPATLPFLQAYKQVGDQLFPPANAQPAAQQPVKIAEKVAKPKPTVSNGDKASAAAPSRSTPRKTAQLVNPLAMSDEEFSKLAGIQI